MRNAREQWNKRKIKYLHLLRKAPAHEYAVTQSLMELTEPEIYDEIFLHVFAPAVVSYVGWVLKDALRRGTQRLYFLSRDGWLMYQAAKRLAGDLTVPPGIRYLKVSRYSLRRAEYLISGKKCLDLICTGGIDITFRRIMLRAALTEEEIRQIARLTCFENKMDRVLSYRQIMDLKEQLEKIDLFFEYVKGHSQKCFDTALGYLRQEGLMDEIPKAVVDSGWIGTTQQSLKNLVHAGITKECSGNEHAAGMGADSFERIGNNSAEELEGYYFGIYELPEQCDPSKYHGFYIHNRQGAIQNIRRKVNFSVCLFEAVISSPEGMTLGYEKHDLFVPADNAAGNPNANRMKRNQMLLDLYLEHYRIFCDGRNQKQLSECGSRNEQKMIWHLLKRCMGRPAAQEAEILGSLQFCDDVLEHNLQNVAAGWGQEELKKQRFLNKVLIKAGIRQGILHESGWPEGSFVNAGMPGRIPQEHCYKYLMYLKKRLRSIFAGCFAACE